MAQVSRSVGYEFIGTVTRVLPAGNRKVGKTMAYYNIAKVHYHDKDNDTFIEKVKTSGGIEKTRSTVVSDIEDSHIIMDEKLEQIDGQKARAAYIRTRVVSALEASRYEDPLRFKQFSQRIQDTLEEYRKSRDDRAYYLRMQRMSDDFRQGFVGHTYPACIEENNDAKAFYGILEEPLIKLSDSQDESFASDIGNLSICINNAIKQNTKVDWRTNRIVHDRINQAMEDLLWEFADDHRISLPMDVLDTLLEDMMRTAMNRY